MNNDYITMLVKSNGQKTSERKVWSIGLESTLIPFFTATNATGRTKIDRDAIGSPLRLAYDQDNSVKFSKNGKPIIKVAKPIADEVKNMRVNFIANLQAFTQSVKAENAEAYNSEAIACMEAGKPIFDRDQANLNLINKAIEAEAKAKAEAEAELINSALNHAEAEAEAEAKADKKNKKALATA
jgi:hypothetical protein